MEEIKKKRGRKPLSLKKDVDKNVIDLQVSEIKEHQECLIVNIPFEKDLMCDTIIQEDIQNSIAEENKNLKKEIEKLKEQLQVLNSNRIEKPVTVYNSTLRELPCIKLDNIAGKNYLCWWCCHSFNNLAVYLPHKYCENTFFVSGYFCSFNCCLSHNFNTKDIQSYQRTNLINLMYKIITGRDTRIIPAPQKELLKAFGGNLTIEEFRQDSIQLGLERRVYLPPLKSILYIVDEDNREQLFIENRSNLYVPLDKKEVAKAKAELKLKRSNPIKNKHISLEQSLGLIKKTDNL